jgi:hypothetical protein
MPQLSATTLKLFQECPRCFWLHVNRKVERPRGPFPSLPSGIDRILKVYFDGYRRQGKLPPLIAGKIEGQLSSTALTLGFNDETTGARLWGKLDDCVALPDGRMMPLDHKTRACPPDDVSYTEQYYLFQMDVYTLLLERNGYQTSRHAYVVYYCPEDGVLHDGIPFSVTVHHVATDPQRAYKIFTAGCACLAGPLPESSPTCGYCRWIATRAAQLAIEGAVPMPAVRRSAAAPAVPEDLFA